MMIDLSLTTVEPLMLSCRPSLILCFRYYAKSIQRGHQITLCSQGFCEQSLNPLYYKFDL